MKGSIGVCAIALLALHGCGKSMPTCTDRENTQLIKEIFDDELAKQSFYYAGGSHSLKLDTTVNLTTILPQSVDDKVGKVTCKASIDDNSIANLDSLAIAQTEHQ